eukprot:998855_1
MACAVYHQLCAMYDDIKVPPTKPITYNCLVTMGSFKKDGKRVKKKIPSEKTPKWHLLQSKFIQAFVCKKIQFYSGSVCRFHWQFARTQGDSSYVCLCIYILRFACL